MIPVPPLTHHNEPALFDVNCREPGGTWLQKKAKPGSDPHDMSEWWSQFQPDLARHFNFRCGWLATCIQLEGVVDHWLSCGPVSGKPSPHRHLAFEWTNYRYASGRINSIKQTLDDEILDPCEVQDGWFEVSLPSFQLETTPIIPDEFQARAEATLEKLQLRNGYHARLTRWNWYKSYFTDPHRNLDRLRQDAPLVAAAVEKALAEGRELPDPTVHEIQSQVVRRQRSYAPRSRRMKKKSHASAPPPYLR